MEDSDLVLLVLAGLGDDYEALIQNVTSRREDVTYREIKAMFVGQRIDKKCVFCKRVDQDHFFF